MKGLCTPAGVQGRLTQSGFRQCEVPVYTCKGRWKTVREFVDMHSEGLVYTGWGAGKTDPQ